MNRKSLLDKIDGIGAVKKSLLLKKFGSIKNIKQLTKEELMTIDGINDKIATNIINYLK